jgi:hypothetical protein
VPRFASGTARDRATGRTARLQLSARFTGGLRPPHAHLVTRDQPEGGCCRTGWHSPRRPMTASRAVLVVRPGCTFSSRRGSCARRRLRWEAQPVTRKRDCGRAARPMGFPWSRGEGTARGAGLGWEAQRVGGALVRILKEPPGRPGPAREHARPRRRGAHYRWRSASRQSWSALLSCWAVMYSSSIIGPARRTTM